MSGICEGACSAVEQSADPPKGSPKNTRLGGRDWDTYHPYGICEVGNIFLDENIF